MALHFWQCSLHSLPALSLQGSSDLWLWDALMVNKPRLRKTMTLIIIKQDLINSNFQNIASKIVMLVMEEKNEKGSWWWRKWELLVHLSSLLPFNLKLLERELYLYFQFFITHLHLTLYNLTSFVGRTALLRIWLVTLVGFSSDPIHFFSSFDSLILHLEASHLFFPISYRTLSFSNVLSNYRLPFELQTCTLNCMLNI